MSFTYSFVISKIYVKIVIANTELYDEVRKLFTNKQ